MKNIYRTFVACLKYTMFWIVATVQIPIVVLIPQGRLSVAYSRFFYSVLMKITGVRIKIIGKLSPARPLLLVSNHISVFELAAFPAAGLGSFFGKAEIEKYPLVGWFARKFGVVFINRSSSKARTEIAKLQEVMSRVKYPMTIFPEGTTNNGNFIYPFKSAAFSVAEQIRGFNVQPVAMVYRYPDGRPIPDRILTDDYSCPDNRKIKKYNLENSKSELLMNPERSAFGQLFNVMKRGGLSLEINLLPAPPLAGMDRKQIAEALHKIINDKYFELKDKSECLKQQ